MKKHRETTQEPWVDVDEVAAYLSVRRESIYRWIGKRGFPVRRVGRLFRFRLSEVDAWVKKGGGSAASTKDHLE